MPKDRLGDVDYEALSNLRYTLRRIGRLLVPTAAEIE